MRKLFPFAIQKGLEGLAGEPNHVKKLRNSSLLVESATENHSGNLLRSKIVCNVPIQVSLHVSLNTSKGVIKSRVDNKYKKLFDTRPIAIRTFGLRIKQFLTASNNASYFVLPTWYIRPPKIVLDLMHLNVFRTDASIYQKLFVEIQETYRWFTIWELYGLCYRFSIKHLNLDSTPH